MIRFHGGPVTPLDAAVRMWTGRHALVSFAYPAQTALAFEVAQSVLLDNSAFTLWGEGKTVDVDAVAAFVRRWQRHPGFAGAIICDDITGSSGDNDRMIARWLLQGVEGGIPVWHLHEDLDRLERLVRGAEARVYPAVALGSSGAWDTPGKPGWWDRIGEAMTVACDSDGLPRCRLHGLRMLDPEIFGRIPLASADSTNVARNIGIDKKWSGSYAPLTNAQRAAVLAERIDHAPTCARWVRSPQLNLSLELTA